MMRTVGRAGNLSSRTSQTFFGSCLKGNQSADDAGEGFAFAGVKGDKNEDVVCCENNYTTTTFNWLHNSTLCSTKM